MAFRSGARAAEKASKSSGANFARTEFFRLEDGDSAILRFLTEFNNRCGKLIDDVPCGRLLQENPENEDQEICTKHGDDIGDPILGWLTTDYHQQVPTRDAPKDYQGKGWPQKMACVCRMDECFEGKYAYCWACDNAPGKAAKPTGRIWALACLREEVRDDDGDLIGYADVMRTVKRESEETPGEYEEVEERAITIVLMAWKNFFGPLSGMASAYGTVLDRDYLIRRSGDGTDTEYRFAALDPIDFVDSDGEEVRFDVRHPEVAERYGSSLTIVDEIDRRVSDDFMGMWFDDSLPQPYKTKGGGKGGGGNGTKRPQRGDEAADREKLMSMANRIKGNSAASSSSDDEEVKQPATKAAATTAKKPAAGSKPKKPAAL